MSDLTTLLSKFLEKWYAGVVNLDTDGTVQFANATGTGFTTLQLGPATGNTASGSLAVTKASATIDMATATGTGTGTITVAAFVPAEAIVLGLTAKVTTILAGAALGTWSIGPSTDTNMWGGGLAVAAGTLAKPSTYTITSGGGVINGGAATDLIITASAGVFSTGVLKVTLHYVSLAAIG